jgi:hypothetical protein
MVISVVNEVSTRHQLTDQGPLMSYVTISPVDTIVSGQGNLMPFASETEAIQELQSKIGTSLWEWVSDRAAQHLLNIVLQRLRTTQVAITLPYRCDTPDFRLYMQADLIPLADGHVEIASRTLRYERRRVARLAKVTTGTEELLRICSWCKRIHVREWVQPELAIKYLRLFECSTMPDLSHGICEDCKESMLVSIRQRRGENRHHARGNAV